MSFATYKKLDVACEQLNTALRLYFEGQELFSAITLAGAAEELLGAHLKALGEPPALEDLVASAVRISAAISKEPSTHKRIAKVANYPKNASKHMDDASDAELRIHLKRDAHDLLSRAVDNYYQLADHFKLPYTALIEKFNNTRGANAA